MPPKPPRAAEPSAAPLASPPAPTPTWALAIIPTKRVGQVEHTVVALRIVGDRVERVAPVPEANWERLDDALRDFGRCALRVYRYRQIDELLAGRA